MNKRVYGNCLDTNAFVKFINDCFGCGVYPRSFRFYRNGALAAGCDMAPYTGKERMHIYSLSKAFTSAACGIASDMGLLDLSERVRDVFPEKMPPEISENLANMRICDLLSMQSGHAECVLNRCIASGDSLRSFFASEVPYAPGTRFVYSTAGTMVCGAAVTRKTGMGLDDFLTKYLFEPLSIAKPRWDTLPDGVCCGGVGVYLSVDDISRFGLMLLNKGVWDGKRVISEGYIADATKKHSVDINNGTPDWVSGYGYQFWMNKCGGYRGDGAFGQLCVVLPEKNEVFAIEAECGNMQKELDCIFAFMNRCVTPDSSSDKEAQALAETAYAVKPTKRLESAVSFACGVNGCRVHGFTLAPDGENLLLTVKTDFGHQNILCGNGKFIYNSLTLFGMSPSIAALHDYRRPELYNVYAAYTADENGVKVTVRHADLPHTVEWSFDFTENTLALSQLSGDLPSPLFSLKRV